MSIRHIDSIVSSRELFAMVFALPASAEMLSPKQFIESLGEETIGAITKPELSEDARLVEFERLFRKGFDVDTISRFVLGRYWKLATPKQREEYQVLFADSIVRTYANRFRQYSGETLVIDGEREASKTDTIVSSEINIPDGPPVRVDWRVRLKNGAFRIVDVIVEGTSMALTQRDDFASVIRRGGGDIEALISELRVKAKPAS